MEAALATIPGYLIFATKIAPTKDVADLWQDFVGRHYMPPYFYVGKVLNPVTPAKAGIQERSVFDRMR